MNRNKKGLSGSDRKTRECRGSGAGCEVGPDYLDAQEMFNL